jgi:hypothetical protein
VEERELESGALDRVRLKLYAEEAMNFLEKAFVPAGDGRGGEGPRLSASVTRKSRDQAIEDLTARAAEARERRLRVLGRAEEVKEAEEEEEEEEEEDEAESDGTDDEEKQIAQDRAAMARYYDEDNFGEDAVVEETLSDTSGGTDRGLFARRVGGEGRTPTASESSVDDRDEWGGDAVETDDDEDADDDHPALASNVETSMAHRAALLERAVRGDDMFDTKEVKVTEESHSGSESGQYEEFTRPSTSFDDGLADELPGPGAAAAAVAAAMVSGGAVAATAAMARSRSGAEEKEGGVSQRRSVVAPELPPELPDFLESPMADAGAGHFAREASASPPPIVKRVSSVTFSERNVAYSPEMAAAAAAERGVVAGDEDCLVQLLLEGANSGGATNEWSEVPLEKSFYRAVPRGATIKLRGRSTSVRMGGGGEEDGVGIRGSVASNASAHSLPELARVQQERDVVMAALEEIVNERSRMAAQIAEMKKTIAGTFGRARSGDKDGGDTGDIDVAAELKDAYAEFQQIIRESEATVNVLEGHIAEGQKRCQELEAANEVSNARISTLERQIEDQASRAIAVRASGESGVDELRRQLARVKEDASEEASRLERKLREAVDDADTARAEITRLSKALEVEKAMRVKAEEATMAAEAAMAKAKAESEAAATNAASRGIGSGSGHMWAQLTAAREEANAAQKSQERAERRLRELQAYPTASASPAANAEAEAKRAEAERRSREEAVAKVVREKDAEYAVLKRELERAEAAHRAALSEARSPASVSSLGSPDMERSLKADLSMKTRQLEDLQRRLDALEVEHKSAVAARNRAEAGAEAARADLQHRRGVNTGAEVTALQAQVHGLQDEMKVRELQLKLQIEDMTQRAGAAEDEASRLRTEVIAAEQQAERALEAERRTRQRAEAQRDAAQQELKARNSIKESSSAPSSVDKTLPSDGGLVKSSSKRGLGALLKSSSKVQIGKKKEKTAAKSGRASSSLSATPTSDDSPGGEKKKHGKRSHG